MSKNHDPIRVGDKFIARDDSVWEVIEDKGFGRIELFCKERSAFISTYKIQVRHWERVRK